MTVIYLGLAWQEPNWRNVIARAKVDVTTDTTLMLPLSTPPLSVTPESTVLMTELMGI